jgi:hypothetical protein
MYDKLDSDRLVQDSGQEAGYSAGQAAGQPLAGIGVSNTNGQEAVFK